MDDRGGQTFVAMKVIRGGVYLQCWHRRTSRASYLCRYHPEGPLHLRATLQSYVGGQENADVCKLGQSVQLGLGRLREATGLKRSQNSPRQRTSQDLAGSEIDSTGWHFLSKLTAYIPHTIRMTIRTCERLGPPVLIVSLFRWHSKTRDVPVQPVYIQCTYLALWVLFYWR